MGGPEIPQTGGFGEKVECRRARVWLNLPQVSDTRSGHHRLPFGKHPEAPAAWSVGFPDPAAAEADLPAPNYGVCIAALEGSKTRAIGPCEFADLSEARDASFLSPWERWRTIGQFHDQRDGDPHGRSGAIDVMASRGQGQGRVSVSGKEQRDHDKDVERYPQDAVNLRADPVFYKLSLQVPHTRPVHPHGRLEQAEHPEGRLLGLGGRRQEETGCRDPQDGHEQTGMPH
ncbi:hypothetical protein CHGG_09089 [Chaetomium globosum CBS 148.51]|uniref:Uncharacterized protein n=1 Tax=Chaetomium globosum (strain ATCC 6205 / CBS 148.51 / DSM 1962 / NBRC 6347 / NRRL 1970) TaxID=306901 RepID=Q2GSG5_CHAGB|nr:uncharacterized protein CHGG_09089 [Chaetomium globosum CBS 148.51]EAQ85075.1 hypothetical protein CHGG_09089 [Chaetomium globosum CBS 148.51]